MYVITFYSFKGGVGRTMALVNTAAELARRGRKVLVVDFDLEAPGLSTYELLRSKKPHPGIVEYVTEFHQTRRSPLVTDFLYEAKPVGKKGGKLWVMPAGRGDAEYRRMLNALNWRTLYQDEEGFLLFEDTRLQWEAELHPDYVLIDARTGHTDIEGICTRQLADAVVVVFYPNEQNLAGLREVCRDIRAEKESGLKKDIRLHFIMSNVSDLDDEDRVLDARLEAFHKELGIGKLDAVIHRYESVLLFNQAVFVLDRPRSRLALEYRRLTAQLMMGNPADREGALRFLRQYAKRHLPYSPRDPEEAVKARLGAEESSCYESDSLFLEKKSYDRLDRIAEHFLDDPDIFVEIAWCRTLKGEFDRAAALLNHAIHLPKHPPNALYFRALCRKQLDDKKGAADDLCNLLRIYGLDNQVALNALRELKAVAPEFLLEAASLPGVQELYFGDLREACDLLADSKEGLEVAIRLLRQFLMKHAEGRDTPIVLPYLIRAGKWREVIESLSAQGTDRLDSFSLFILAIAYWGDTGTLREDLCRLALERENVRGFTEEAQVLRMELVYYRHYGADWLLLWGAKRGNEVRPLLEKTETEVKQGRRRPFSIWRFREVSPDQFVKDCQEFRRMIQGEPIRPAFLGEPAAPVQP